MGASITLAGESLISQKQSKREALLISKFVLANVPGLDTTLPVDRAAGVPQGALVGAALGASVNWKGANWDISTTCPLATPQGMDKEGCQTWFRLGYSI